MVFPVHVHIAESVLVALVLIVQHGTTSSHENELLFYFPHNIVHEDIF